MKLCLINTFDLFSIFNFLIKYFTLCSYIMQAVQLIEQFRLGIIFFRNQYRYSTLLIINYYDKSKFKIYSLLLNSTDEKYLMHFDERYLIKYKTMTSLLYQNIYLSYVRGYLNVAVQDNQCINHMFINTF